MLHKLLAILFFAVPGFTNATNTATTSILPEAILNQVHAQNSKYTLVQVWSASCEPCGEEVKQLNLALASANEFQPGTLTILGVPVQSRKKEILEFTKHFKPNFTQLAEALTADNTLKNKTVPWTILFTKTEESIVKEWTGKISSADLLSTIKTNEQNKNNQKKGNL